MTQSVLAGSLRVAARWDAGALTGWNVQLVRPPVARALIGKGVGDIVEVTTPKGRRHYEILMVMYQ